MLEKSTPTPDNLELLQAFRTAWRKAWNQGSFDPFCSYDFSKSQESESKYGLAIAFLDAVHTDDWGPLPPIASFDMRRGSTARFVAYWTYITHLIRCHGCRLLAALVTEEGILTDPISPILLHVAFTSPPTLDQYQRLIAPATKSFLEGEARRMAKLRRLALSAFWGKGVLRHVTKEQRDAVVARSKALWQQEMIEFDRSKGLPTDGFSVPWQADEVEIAATCHFLRMVFDDAGMMASELFVSRGPSHSEPSKFEDPFLGYALEIASRNWLEEDLLRSLIIQREKALLQELKTRIAALSACLNDLQNRETNPNQILARLNSFWPDTHFNDYNGAMEYIKSNAP